MCSAAAAISSRRWWAISPAAPISMSGVYWTLLNLGAGNLALIKERDAEIGQAIAERSRTINRARDEVSAVARRRPSRAERDRRGTPRAGVSRACLTSEDLDRTMFRGGEKPARRLADRTAQ